jgi:hypothetical protein
VYYKPATAKAKATPPTAHPAFPVTRDMPAVLVLLASVADEVPEPVVLAVLVPEVWVATVVDCTLPVKRVTSERLIDHELEPPIPAPVVV